MSVDGSRQSNSRGQVVIEYFILFAVVALACVVTLTTFDDGWRSTLQGFVGRAAEYVSGERISDPNAP